MRQPTIYLDCDGVLADFDRGFEEHWGMLSADYEKRFGSTRFWSEIENHPDFFGTLPLMRDAMVLYEGVKHLRPTILTGMPKGGWADPQKRRWAATHFPNVRVITCLSAKKSQFCQPGDILIDDTPKHRSKWIAAGGVWIDHKDATSSLETLWAHRPDLRPGTADTALAKAALIDHIISAYHTTRVAGTPAAAHILSKPYVKQAFEALGL